MYHPRTEFTRPPEPRYQANNECTEHYNTRLRGRKRARRTPRYLHASSDNWIRKATGIKTKEYLRPPAKEKTQIALALRCTQSRRGAVQHFVQGIQDGRFAEVVETILCGQAYRGALRQKALAARIERTAALLVRGHEQRPFKDIDAYIDDVIGCLSDTGAKNRHTCNMQNHLVTSPTVAFVVVHVAASREDAVGVGPVGKREPRGDTQALRTAHTSSPVQQSHCCSFCCY